MNRRNLFQALAAGAASLLLPPLRAAKALPSRVRSQAARWRHRPHPVWLKAYGALHVATVTRPPRSGRVDVSQEEAFQAAMEDTEADC